MTCKISPLFAGFASCLSVALVELLIGTVPWLWDPPAGWAIIPSWLTLLLLLVLALGIGGGFGAVVIMLLLLVPRLQEAALSLVLVVVLAFALTLALASATEAEFWIVLSCRVVGVGAAYVAMLGLRKNARRNAGEPESPPQSNL